MARRAPSHGESIGSVGALGGCIAAAAQSPIHSVSRCRARLWVHLPAFKWRHTARVIWGSTWRGLEVSLAWRYFSPVTLDALSPNPNLAAPPGQTVANGGISNTDARISSRSYFDLSTAVQLSNRVSFRLGINNLLDKAPPIVGGAVGNAITTIGFNGNTFPQVYDSLGRYVFGTLTAQF